MQPGESLMSLLLYIAHDSCAAFRDILLLAHCGIILSEYRREWRTSCRLTVVTEKAKHDFHVASIVSVRLVGLKNLSCLHISNTWSQRHCVFGLSVHQCVRTYMYVRPYSHTYCHTYYYWYSITHSLSHSMLKSFLFCKSSLPQPFLFLLQDSLYGFPRLFTVTSEHIRLFTF